MNWQPPKFDRFQFEKRFARAVSVETGISFQDYGSMHVQYRKVKQERRLETPSWAVNDAELREVLLKFCERRVFMRNWQNDGAGLTHEERISRIRQLELKRAAEFEQNLIELRQRWKTAPEEYKPELETQITNLDTQLCDLRRGNLALAVGVVYFYYRLGYNSPETARELGIKPPHVRQTLARLHNAANGTTYRSPNPKWGRIREFKAELRRIKNLWRMVKKVTERKSAREQLRAIGDGIVTPKSGRRGTPWTRAKILFIHFHLLKGVPRETIARKLGIQHAHSMMQGYRYFLANPHRLHS